MRFLTSILMILLALAVGAGEPFCSVTTFDEESGLSQRLVKGIVQDHDGYIWIGTWNGLNRFDGRKMATIRPGSGDEAFRYSNRIGDLRLSPRGNLLCRIDDRVSVFDVGTMEFRDLHAELKNILGTPFEVRRILPTLGSEVVISTKDERYIVIPDEASVADAYMTDTLPRYKYAPRASRLRGKIGGIRSDEIVMSRIDDAGTVWVITRDGRILAGDSADGPFSVMKTIDATPGTLMYCITDDRGDVWLRSNEGAHRVSMGHLPYSTIATAGDSRVRASVLDGAGRVWLAESDADAVGILDPATGVKKYLDASGNITDGFSRLGASIYSMTPAPDGSMWLGSKPSGVFRLTPDGHDRYRVEHFDIGNVYDFIFDRKGRMWVATMGNGLIQCPQPAAASPVFTPLNTRPGYPVEARLIRHLTIAGDSLLLAATTSGLLAVDIAGTIPGDSLRASLIVSRPGSDTSLGNIAVMDVAAGPDGEILVATESDGLNVTSPTSVSRPDDWVFSHHNGASGLTDVVLSVSPTTDSSGRYTITSNDKVYLYDPVTGDKMVYGRWFWGNRLRFSDARPVMLPDGRMILGHEKGAVIMTPDTAAAGVAALSPVHFTSVSIQGQPDRLLPASVDTIVLSKTERNLTIRFAMLDFAHSADIDYTARLSDNPAVHVGNNGSLTLLDLDPGEYSLSVTASSPAGSMAEATETVTIIVTPTFWETSVAKILYVLLAILLTGSVAWIVIYIRSIKRKQREILNSYLALVNNPQPDTPAEVKPSVTASTPGVDNLSPDDKILMDNVTTYVTSHIADSEMTVDDLAQAVMLSRSSLNRKMKSIMGVTPAEFIRESRLSKAARLLSQTDLSIKEIAFDCGFADINYFGKCFKASRGVAPGAYRKSEVK